MDWRFQKHSWTQEVDEKWPQLGGSSRNHGGCEIKPRKKPMRSTKIARRVQNQEPRSVGMRGRARNHTWNRCPSLQPSTQSASQLQSTPRVGGGTENTQNFPTQIRRKHRNVILYIHLMAPQKIPCILPLRSALLPHHLSRWPVSPEYREAIIHLLPHS